MPIEYFRHTDNGLNIPIADGAVTLEGVSTSASVHQVYVSFYGADGETLATPTDGTLTFRGGIVPGQYLEASSGGTIIAADVTPGDAAYTPPVFNGGVFYAKMTKGDIAGASYVRACIWSDD